MKARFGIQASCLLLLTLLSFTSGAQLKAGFSASPTIGCAPLIVQFNDESEGNPTQWKWDLGNGTISFLQNPSVSYFNPGQYTVKLVISDDINADSIVKTQYITVSAKPDIEFGASATSGCFPLPVQFKDQSTAGSGTISNWHWDFGDGLGSAEQNPLHTYMTAGNYNVSLRVTNSEGCLTTVSKSQFVQISAGVTAAYSSSVPNGCKTPVTINFENQSAGTGTLAYDWSFGDGSGSSLVNPSHTYSEAGSFTVRLIVTNSTGCKDTIIKPNSIIVGNVAASFSTPDKVCAGAPVVFTNNSTPKPLSVQWSFGDRTASTQLNPSKTFASPGSYDVKMVVSFGGCTDSMTRAIKVLPKPVASFISGDTANCGIPFSVQFTNKSQTAIAYQWNFGDNTTSVLADPVHTYNSFGSFTVQLVITNENGCTDTIRKTNLVKITPPVTKFKNLPDSGCAPFTKSFSSVTTTAGTVLGYQWDFGDGTVSAIAAPSHTYNIPGIYTVTLVITTTNGCRDTAVMKRAVIVTNKPVPKFSATPREACARTPINFQDESTGTPTNWLWSFGDGSTSTGQHPLHVYNDTGYFDVQLVVWNAGCADTISYKDYIHIKPPVARYKVSYNCKKPYERIFTDQSVGADEWNWDFGDGNTSTDKSPTHTYSIPGAYTVTLTVRNNALSSCDFTTKKNVQIIDMKALFFASDTLICKGTKISFNTSLNVAEVSSFKWNFGDGTGADSVRNNATHVYKVAGTYTVRLITTDIQGCKDTMTRAQYIRVDGPTAKFASVVPGSCLNSTISFNDQSVSDSIHPIQTWKWNYADGNTETLMSAPFQHTYLKPGIYKVGLTVTDNRGCSDSFKLPTPLVISKPIASFKSKDTTTCPGKPVAFTNQSSGTSLKYLWNFGDNTTSSVQNPVHTYTADGSYGIKLVITDPYGCTDSVIKPGFVTVTTSVANFVMSDSFSTCPPLIVQFTDLSTNAIARVWDFGDGTSASVQNPSHFYNYPGIYTISLTIKGRGGCVDVMKKNITINGPTGSFTYKQTNDCNPVNVNFVATSRDRISFIWDFNDGATSPTTDSIVTHTYTNQGSYIPKMILIDPDGCQVPITGKDTILVSGVRAKFKFSDKTICDSGVVIFKDSSISNDIITGYKWALGDGNTSLASNPKHSYTSTGVYYPKLTVTTKKGCVDSVTSPNPVKIVASPKIEMTKTANGCTPIAVTFKGIITAPDTSKLTWNWNFGNGNTSTVKDPPVQNYSVSGVYKANLTATNSSGCQDTASKDVNAYIIPTVYAGPDTVICKGTGVVLRTTGASSYNWNAAPGLSCTNCANPVATPDSMTKYVVKGTSFAGCIDYDSVLVKVNRPFVIKVSNRDTLCKGQDTRLFAAGADRFNWSPSTGLDNSNSASPIAAPDTTTTYRVIGADNKGCFRDTGYVPIKVYPIPAVNAGIDKKINVGQTIDLVPVISPDVTEVIWSPTGTVFRNNYPSISVKPNTTTEYTVDVSNRGGCRTSDRVSVYVICNGSNVFIPNTFSPNGDGANDIFYPRGTGLFKVKMFRIFNRWGELVFERSGLNANDPTAGWDGTYKGMKMPADVFVYMIDIVCDNNSILPYKGNIALVQ